MNNEWYTPAPYIEAARAVMGRIDLDPASCEQANQTVQATRYYSIEQNGLMQAWSGCLWLNPPYSQPRPGRSSIRAWIQRLVSSYQNGEIEQAICLIPNDTSTRWFSWLWEYVVCFPPKRIQFDVVGKDHREQPTFGTCFVYLGANQDKFVEVFSKFGRVVRAIDSAPARAYALELWTA